MYDEDIEDILTAHGLRFLKAVLLLFKNVAIGAMLFAVLYVGVRRIRSSEAANRIPAVVHSAAGDVPNAAAVVRSAAAIVRSAADEFRDTGESLATAAQDGWKEADKKPVVAGMGSGLELEVAESVSTRTTASREPISTSLP